MTAFQANNALLTVTPSATGLHVAGVLALTNVSATAVLVAQIEADTIIAIGGVEIGGGVVELSPPDPVASGGRQDIPLGAGAGGRSIDPRQAAQIDIVVNVLWLDVDEPVTETFNLRAVTVGGGAVETVEAVLVEE